jgi:cytochrome c551/c552
MKAASLCSHPRNSQDGVNQPRRALRASARGALTSICLTAALVSCSSPRPAQPQQPLAEISLSGKSSQEIAEFVFAHYGCNSCHTLGKAGRLGFTERGRQVGKNFEGCTSLLTAMNVIVHVREENRTAEDRRKAAQFQEFGCAACHQITPGRMGLTEIGSKLASLHMTCPEVQRLLSER